MHAKNGSEIPLDLGMALMQNKDAFILFSALDSGKQQKIIDGCKNIDSRDEMRSYVSEIRADG